MTHTSAIAADHTPPAQSARLLDAARELIVRTNEQADAPPGAEIEAAATRAAERWLCTVVGDTPYFEARVDAAVCAALADIHRQDLVEAAA